MIEYFLKSIIIIILKYSVVVIRDETGMADYSRMAKQKARIPS
jgi:hypothetical protein